jgi:hypothetical protein
MIIMIIIMMMMMMIIYIYNLIFVFVSTTKHRIQIAICMSTTMHKFTPGDSPYHHKPLGILSLVGKPSPIDNHPAVRKTMIPSFVPKWGRSGSATWQ